MTPAEALGRPVEVRERVTGVRGRVTRLDELDAGRVRVQFAVPAVGEARRRGWSLVPREMDADTELTVA